MEIRSRGRRLNVTQDELYNLYITQDLSVNDIAQLWNCSVVSVRKK